MVIKKLINTLLVAVLLVATTGVTLNKHYCMGKLKSIAVNEHAEHCFEGEDEQMPCCQEISEELRVEEITTTVFDFDATPHLYELAIVNFVLLNNSYYDAQVEKPTFLIYDPPLPDRDIPVLIQSFLI